MIATILSVEQAFTKSGAEYQKVTVADGTGKETTKSVFDNLKEKWALLKENATLEFKMQKSGQFWNVVDILPIETPPPQPPGEPLPEQQAEIGKAVEAGRQATTIAPQAIGKTGYKADPAKMDSIERQVSIKLACDISPDTDTLEQIFAKADKIYRWIRGN